MAKYCRNYPYYSINSTFVFRYLLKKPPASCKAYHGTFLDQFSVTGPKKKNGYIGRLATYKTLGASIQLSPKGPGVYAS